MEDIVVSFGRILRRLRLEKEMSQERLALVAGVQRNTVVSLELGQKQPTLRTIAQLATALDIQVSDLLRLVESDLNT